LSFLSFLAWRRGRCRCYVLRCSLGCSLRRATLPRCRFGACCRLLC
jgi:hypothetical protein